jgi:hypothetical protein
LVLAGGVVLNEGGENIEEYCDLGL